MLSPFPANIAHFGQISNIFRHPAGPRPVPDPELAADVPDGRILPPERPQGLRCLANNCYLYTII
jgi:hypothetical protein